MVSFDYRKLSTRNEVSREIGLIFICIYLTLKSGLLKAFSGQVIVRAWDDEI
jgi:hypothetical protein